MLLLWYLQDETLVSRDATLVLPDNKRDETGNLFLNCTVHKNYDCYIIIIINHLLEYPYWFAFISLNNHHHWSTKEKSTLNLTGNWVGLGKCTQWHIIIPFNNYSKYIISPWQAFKIRSLKIHNQLALLKFGGCLLTSIQLLISTKNGTYKHHPKKRCSGSVVCLFVFLVVVLIYSVAALVFLHAEYSQTTALKTYR